MFGFAQETATGAGGQGLGLLFSYLPLVLIFVIFYALILRPQNKAAKEQAAMLAALQKGDRVQTIGGLLGEVAQVTTDVVHVKIAAGVNIAVVRTAIARKLTATENQDFNRAGPAAGPVVEVVAQTGKRRR